MNAATVSAAQEMRARLRELARRCRELSEMTAVPELTRELSNIADDIEKEAEMAQEE
jgi:predicted transcriptional regulator